MEKLSNCACGRHRNPLRPSLASCCTGCEGGRHTNSCNIFQVGMGYPVPGVARVDDCPGHRRRVVVLA